MASSGLLLSNRLSCLDLFYPLIYIYIYTLLLLYMCVYLLYVCAKCVAQKKVPFDFYDI